MAFLVGNSLIKVLKQTLKKQFDPDRIEQVAYELSLGGQAYLTDAKNKKPEILNSKNKTITINPGQFALLLSEEWLEMPNNVLGFISIKAGIKFKGIVNVSGFHVDPGFKGQLLFSIYNAGPAKITLKKGDPYFLIWFARLSDPIQEGNIYNKVENKHQNQNDIPTIYLDALKSGDLASPNSLSKRINKLKTALRFNYFVLTFFLAAAVASFWYVMRQKSNYEDGFKDGYNKIEIEDRVNKKVDLILNSKIIKLL